MGLGDERGAEEAARQFAIDGKLIGAEPYGTGHIHDTYRATFAHRGEAARCIVQRINTRVFSQPDVLMENIVRVTAHLAAGVADAPDRERLVLSLIATRDGGSTYVDGTGGYWRAYRFIEGARTYDAIETLEQAYQAARAFGRFQGMLLDLPEPRLQDTIPDFHHTPKRFAAFEAAIEAAMQADTGRLAAAHAEVEFAMAHRGIASLLLDAGLPERITHNDTKFNNVLLDDTNGRGLCVIDLDTVMPGLALYDFGDMVRTTTSPAAEDELDLSRVAMQFPMFEALLRGYLSTAGEFLTQPEKDCLADAGKVLAFEQGIRFLSDYLSGDMYYKVQRAEQNLDRCRTQFKLLESILEQEERMLRLIEQV